MRATDPLKACLAARRFRAVGPGGLCASGGNGHRPPTGSAVLKCSYRPPDADFYCWKYGVWYNTLDCCYRHVYRTYSGCAGCGQGAGNVRTRGYRGPAGSAVRWRARIR
ncbi:MAG: hypothetical protein ACE5JH_04710 [Acidobacteriota bacterium]